MKPVFVLCHNCSHGAFGNALHIMPHLKLQFHLFTALKLSCIHLTVKLKSHHTF